MVIRRDFTNQGRASSYAVVGSGPDLLIIPGELQTIEMWESAGYVDDLAADYRVVVVDLRPTDGSTPSARRFGPEPVVDDVLAIAERESISQATVWGYGTGAGDALTIARRRPELAARVVTGGFVLSEHAADGRASGIDRELVVERCASALDRGDWEGFFDAAPWTGPPEYRAMIAESYDPIVAAAIVRSSLLRVWSFSIPPAPVMAYWGDAEPFHVANLETVDSLPVEWTTLPGDFGSVFLNRAAATRAVRGFSTSRVQT